MARRQMTPSEHEASRRLRALWDTRAESLRLSQESVGIAMGITQGAVWQYLNARLPIALEACIKWAEILQCDPAEIRPDLAERFDAVIRLRTAGSGGVEPPPLPNPALLRACLSAAFDEARQADRYPTSDLIATLAIDLYARANQRSTAVLERASATRGSNLEG